MAAYQLSLFPTEDEQIAYIAEAESYTLSAFSMSIPQDDIDHILRMEGNADHARMEIVTEFSKGRSVEEIAAFLQNTFHGGNGIVTENGRYSVWYAEDGIHIANGDAARYLTSAKVVSWQEAAERIGQLLIQGEYATNVELAEAPGHERMELAASLWYLKHDLSDDAAAQGYLSRLSDIRGSGYPEETAWLAERLKEYGIGGSSHAVSGATHSGEEHGGKGVSLKKQDCPEIQLNWTNVAKRISELIRKDRFLTPEEKAQYEQLQRQTAERSAGWSTYNAVKEAHPDDIVLYQVGDFFEMYGEDAEQAAELLNLNLTTRNIPGAGRVEMCGVPSHNLE